MSATTCTIVNCGRPALARNWCAAHYRRWHQYGDPNHGPPLPPSRWGSCRIDGCEDPAHANGLCSSHNWRLKHHGDPMAGRRRRGSEAPTCDIEDCDHPAKARNLCEGHYNRLMKHGSPLGGRRSPLRGIAPEQRFWEYVDKRGADECWPWIAHLNYKGYGQFGLNRGSIPAHRFVYELERGPIPEEHQIHHTCDFKACCNPSHLVALEPGKHTLLGNGFSGHNARKTHCIRGHELTPENCYDYANRRVCKLCARERARKQHQ